MSKVFISYRRSDTQDIAGRIFDHLILNFGINNIFKDVDSIEPGVNFREKISESINECDVVLILIGKKWLGEENNGKRKIDSIDDFVKFEIETALKNNKHIIPISINNTIIPSQEILPISIKEISFKNALHIRPDPDFTKDIKKLLSSLNKLGINYIEEVHTKEYIKIEYVAALLHDLKYITKYFFETIPSEEVKSFFLYLQNYYIAALQIIPVHVDHGLCHGTDYLMRAIAHDPFLEKDYGKNNLRAAFRNYIGYAKKNNILNSRELPSESDALNNIEQLTTISIIFREAENKKIITTIESKLCDMVLSMVSYLINIRRKNELLNYSARDVYLIQDYIDSTLKDQLGFRLPKTNEDLSEFRIYCQHSIEEYPELE